MPRADISEQDAHIAGYILEAGRALVIAVNKWDGLDDDSATRSRSTSTASSHFLDFAKTHFISALQGHRHRAR